MKKQGWPKLGLLLIFVLLSSSSMAVLTFGEDKAINTSNTSFSLSYTDISLNGDVDISYYKNDSMRDRIGNSSESPYLVEFRVNDSGEFVKNYNLTAFASNSTDNKTRHISLQVDTDNPEITNVGLTRFGNGSISFLTSISEDGAGLSRLELIRSGSTINQKDLSGLQEKTNLIDKNLENLYQSLNYTLMAIDEAGNFDLYETSIKPKDGQPPTYLSNIKDGAEINNRRDSKLEVAFTDSLSGLRNASVSVLNNTIAEENISEKKFNITVNIDNLDNHETFSVTVKSTDKSNNTLKDTWQFTTDRSPPEVISEPWPRKEFITDRTTLGIEYISSEQKVSKVRCILNGNIIGTDGKRNNNDVYSCGKVNPSNYSDGRHELKGRFFDSIGNSKEVYVGEYIFDTRKPEVLDLDVNPKYTSGTPNISLEVSDSGSGVERVYYALDLDEENQTIETARMIKHDYIDFSLTTVGIPSGERTINVWVRDGTDKFSHVASKDFYLRKNGAVHLSYDKSKFELPAADLVDREVKITNKGNTTLVEGSILVSEPFKQRKELPQLAPNSSHNFKISFNTSNSSPGLYRPILYSNSREINNETLNIIVRASKSDKESLNKNIQTLEDKVEILKTNYSKLKERGASNTTLKPLKSTISSLESNISELQNLVEQEKQYLAIERVDKIKKKASKSQEVVEEVENSYIANKWILRGGVAFTLIIITGLGSFYYWRTDFFKKLFSEIQEKMERLSPELPSINPVPYTWITKYELYRYRLKRKIRRIRGKELAWEGYH